MSETLESRARMPVVAEWLMNDIFVFGSNLAGIHGRGSALHARKLFGALQGVGEGRMGSSYAIPTKDKFMRSLSLDEITVHVQIFLTYAREHSDLTFYMVEIGCGLAKYTPEDIAPMFKGYPSNVKLPIAFLKVLNESLPHAFYLPDV